MRQQVVLASLLVLLSAAMVEPATASAVINEIVTDPHSDWNDSSGGDGIAFNDVPGTGTIGPEDDWIEIVNASGSVVDLTGWTLQMVDTTPETVTLSSPGNAVLIFSAGSSVVAFQPGARLVIGDPPGALSNAFYLVLRDGSSVVVDDVEIGDDLEGDGAGDGAPGPGQDGNATGLGDETIARLPNGVDTDDDDGDFVKVGATFGSSNDVALGVGDAPVSRLSLDIGPQPLNGAASLTLHLPEPCNVRLSIHDVAGREVVRLAASRLGRGAHPFRWSQPAPSGVYWARVLAEGAESGRRMQLARKLSVVR